jgi:hypothetical protein
MDQDHRGAGVLERLAGAQHPLAVADGHSSVV